MRPLPSDLEAERSLLGALIATDAAREQVTRIRAEDFCAPKHRDAFTAIMALYSKGDAIDGRTVADALTRGNPKRRAESSMLVAELLEAFTVASSAPELERIVGDHSKLRRLIDASHRISEAAFSEPEDVDKVIAEAEWLVLSVAQDAAPNDPTTLVSEHLRADQHAIEEAGKSQGGLIGIGTGFPSLDRTTHGWQPGQLVVVGAQTGHGKTSVLVRFAAEAARRQLAVLFVSLEMAPKEIRYRLYSQEAGVSLDAIQTGHLGDGWQRLTDVSADISSWRFAINGRKQQSVADIAADARRVASKLGGLDLICVDYLQYVIARDSNVQRYEQVGQVARDLKDLAGMLECPLITAAQLNDNLSHREDKRPRMGDLRESRGIEHAADIVLFGYWDWRHNHNAENFQNYELILAKHRQGAPDITIPCLFDAPQNLITERKAHQLRAV